MRRGNRDEFPLEVRRRVAQRVNYLCSRPTCHAFTSGPHSADDKPLITGIAAHIRGAAPGGPRYDANQTDDARSSSQNAIWLCRPCSHEVDADACRFPSELLEEWKATTERFVGSGAPVPSTPQVLLNTLHGHRLLLGRELDEQSTRRYRDHDLSIFNETLVELRDIHVDIQFPEPLLDTGKVEELPVGIAWKIANPRVRVSSVPHAGGGGAWNLRKGTGIASWRVLHVQIDRLPAMKRARFTVFSTPPESAVPLDWVEQNNSGLHSRYYLQTTYSFQWKGESRQGKAWTYLDYDGERRRVQSSQTHQIQRQGLHSVTIGGLIG